MIILKYLGVKVAFRDSVTLFPSSINIHFMQFNHKWAVLVWDQKVFFYYYYYFYRKKDFCSARMIKSDIVFNFYSSTKNLEKMFHSHRKSITQQKLFSTLIIIRNASWAYNNHHISILEWFLKDHVTLKAGVMMLKIHLGHHRKKYIHNILKIANKIF